MSLSQWMSGHDPRDGFPLPNRPEFFRIYSESVARMLECAEMFLADALWLWGEGPDRREDRAGSFLGAPDRHPGFFLSALAQCAAPSFRPSPLGRYLEEVRTSASLLASFALMFLWDRAREFRPRRCQVCGKFFVSDDRRAVYCSDKHRHTASSRRFRAKKAGTEKE